MKIAFASAIVSSFVLTAIGQQQQSPFAPPAVPPPTAGRTTTAANQGVATNPTGDATTGSPVGDVVSGAFGSTPTNATGGLVVGQPGTNQSGQTGSAPLFLTVTPIPVTDANGQALGTLQQISLSPSGTINFGLVNMGGRLVPVPWQLIVTSAAGRGGLALNVDRGVLQTAPPVAMGQLPLLAQEDIQERILVHFAAQMPAQPTVVSTTTARGGTGGAGVTITGGSTNTVSFNTNFAFTGTNIGRITNNTASNQAINTTSGLRSPTGQTNAAQDLYRGPGSANPTTTPAPNPTGQPGRQQR